VETFKDGTDIIIGEASHRGHHWTFGSRRTCEKEKAAKKGPMRICGHGLLLKETISSSWNKEREDDDSNQQREKL